MLEHTWYKFLVRLEKSGREPYPISYTQLTLRPSRPSRGTRNWH